MQVIPGRGREPVGPGMLTRARKLLQRRVNPVPAPAPEFD